MHSSVALFTRAWIEITNLSVDAKGTSVALFTRAWIEIHKSVKCTRIHVVALFTRAWIEIMPIAYFTFVPTGRPLHEGVD